MVKLEDNKTIDEIDLAPLEREVSHYVSEFKNMMKLYQTNELSPSIFQNIHMSAYGESTSVAEMGQVFKVNQSTVQINVYDPAYTDKIFNILSGNKDHDFKVERKENGITVQVDNLDTKEKKAKLMGFFHKQMQREQQEMRQLRKKHLKHLQPLKEDMQNDLYQAIIKESDSIYQKGIAAMEKQLEERLRKEGISSPSR